MYGCDLHVLKRESWFGVVLHYRQSLVVLTCYAMLQCQCLDSQYCMFHPQFLGGVNDFKLALAQFSMNLFVWSYVFVSTCPSNLLTENALLFEPCPAIGQVLV